MNKRIGLIILTLVTGIIINGCNKEFDAPPEQTIAVGSLKTIADLKDMYVGSSISFSNDETVYAVVTADETSGNIYKNAYIQDGTGAIILRLMASGGLYEGDSIRINLNGTVLSEYNGQMQLDSVDVDNNIVKLATGVVVTPLSITVADLADDTYESYLIRLDGVQFMSSEIGQTYADAVGLYSENRMLEDCFGNSVIVRSSGYANFAGDVVDPDNGSFIGVVGQFNADIQLYIRDITEVNFTGTRCTGGGGGNYLEKDFDDMSITSGGWTVHWTGTTTGSTNWGEWEIFGSVNPVASASNFDFGTFTNYATTSWLVSPAVDLSAATMPVLDFMNVTRYSGAQLELYISTDYDGVSDPASQGTWIDLSSMVTWDTDSGDWTFNPSGTIDLTTYISSSTYIAFKYTGTNVDGATWELDDIIISEN